MDIAVHIAMSAHHCLVKMNVSFSAALSTATDCPRSDTALPSSIASARSPDLLLNKGAGDGRAILARECTTTRPASGGTENAAVLAAHMKTDRTEEGRERREKKRKDFCRRLRGNHSVRDTR